MPAMRSLPAVMAAAHACRLVSDDEYTIDKVRRSFRPPLARTKVALSLEP